MQFVYKEMACDGAKSDVLIRILLVEYNSSTRRIA